VPIGLDVRSGVRDYDYVDTLIARTRNLIGVHDDRPSLREASSLPQSQYLGTSALVGEEDMTPRSCPARSPTKRDVSPRVRISRIVGNRYGTSATRGWTHLYPRRSHTDPRLMIDPGLGSCPGTSEDRPVRRSPVACLRVLAAHLCMLGPSGSARTTAHLRPGAISCSQAPGRIVPGAEHLGETALSPCLYWAR